MGKKKNFTLKFNINFMNLFKKIYILLILLLFLFNSNSYAEVVKKVEAKGNDRISLETLVIFGDIIIGKNYEEADISLLIKKLYETSFFSNISVELKNNKLTLILKENPIVQNIFFEGEKASKYIKKINEIISVTEKSSFVKSNIKSDVNIIKSFYRSLGFYFVKIEADTEDLDNNRINIVYTIDKGDKAKIDKIYFLGEKKYRDKKLRDVITTQQSKFWKFISKNVYLSKERIELDKRLLKNFYRNKGYYEVDITSSNVEYAEGDGFVLTFSINAGKRYRFNKIFAEVSDSLEKSAFNSLESEFNELVGKYYSQSKLTSVLEQIDKLSDQKELQFINHSVLETLDGEGVEVKISIFEGEKFIIEKINVAGNSVTNDSVIRGELLVDEGDPYSELLVNKSLNKLRGRNIFSKVSYTTSPGSTSDVKVLELNVEEKSTGEIMAGAGVGTAGTSFQFLVKENNWLGKGMRVNTGLNVSTEKLSGNINIVDPNFNYSGNSLSGGLEISSTDRSSTTGYKSSRTGFALGTSFEQWESIFLAPSLDIVHEDIEASASSSANLKKMDGTYFNADFIYGITKDMRNQTYQPTEGYLIKFRQSLPLIQDSSSISNGILISKYKEISENVIGSVRYRASVINGIDGDVRLTNRLYTGSKHIRGFVPGKMGPKDGKDFIGGNYKTSISLDAQLPNLLPESYNTDFNVFLDAGNVWGVDYSDTINDSSKIRSSIGVGANVFTLVGPLSFVFSQTLTKKDTDQSETFTFNLGTSF